LGRRFYFITKELKKLKAKSWTLEDRKAGYELVQKTKTNKRL
jgi:hypothetical protein